MGGGECRGLRFPGVCLTATDLRFEDAERKRDAATSDERQGRWRPRRRQRNDGTSGQLEIVSRATVAGLLDAYISEDGRLKRSSESLSPTFLALTSGTAHESTSSLASTYSTL